jgi:hypothetical protein
VVWDRYTPNNCMLALRKFASIISSLWRIPRILRTIFLHLVIPSWNWPDLTLFYFLISMLHQDRSSPRLLEDCKVCRKENTMQKMPTIWLYKHKPCPTFWLSEIGHVCVPNKE